MISDKLENCYDMRNTIINENQFLEYKENVLCIDVYHDIYHEQS